MKKTDNQFFTCPRGCFSMDPGFLCAHGEKGSGDDIVLILDDEPGDSGHSPGEKIAAARERDRERYERRGQAIADRRAAIEKILLALRKELVKTNRWTDLMNVGDQLPQLPATLHLWPSRLAFDVVGLVRRLDEPSWL